MTKLFKAAIAAAFLLAAAPVVGPSVGLDQSAQARMHHKKPMKKKAMKKRAHGKHGKYQYQYIPNAGGRTGGWR